MSVVDGTRTRVGPVGNRVKCATMTLEFDMDEASPANVPVFLSVK